MVRPVLDAVAQHVDGAALADLALQAGQELAPRRAVLAEVERLGRLGCVSRRKAESCTRSTQYSRS